jgi:hypothetical protein
MKTDALLIVANSYPLLSLAGNQLPSPLLSNLPLTPTHPLGPVLYYNNEINNFGLLDPEQGHCYISIQTPKP